MKRLIYSLFFCCFAIVSFAQLSIDDIWKNYTYYPFGISNIMHDNYGKGFYMLESNKVLHVSYSNEKGATLVDFSNKTFQSVQSVVVSPNATKILAATGTQILRRNSFSALYMWYQVGSDTLMQLFSPNISIQKPTFSPKNDEICYFFENNLYLYNFKDAPYAITTNGKIHTIINGMPDWVSEEEFDMQQGFAWSPSGTHIAYLQWDETDVPLYTFSKYGNVYPEQYTYKYPKAGQAPARTTAYVYSVQHKKTIPVTFPKQYTYIPEFSWIDTSRIAFTLLNRLQNHVDIAVYSLHDASCTIVYSFQSKTFVDIPTYFTHVAPSNTFIVRNDNDGFLNLYEYSYTAGLLKQLTRNMGDITNVYGYFPNSHSVFFQATNNNPLERYVFELSLANEQSQILSSEPGTHTIDINDGGTAWIREYSNKSPLLVTYIEGKQIENPRNPLGNYWMQDIAETFKFSPVEYMQIPTQQNEQLHAYIFKPYNFKKNKKYPVIVSVYGGPGQQKVTNEWTYDFYWNQYLAQQGYIVVQVDCRGTDGRGSEFRKQTYLQLGTMESYDFAATANYLRILPYVNPKQIAIQGWSYGAYMALLTAAKYPDAFNAVIAIAPVTDWKLYDNIYTERYMQTPELNPNGYEQSSVFTFVEHIKAPILLAHGTADDNVHIQNTYELVEKLIAHNKDFDVLVFPNNEHSLFGDNSRVYLYTKYLEFLKNRF